MLLLAKYDLSHIKRLELWDCGFTAEGVRAIAQANLINMNVVELTSNAIGWVGADAVINAKWPSLTELFVGDCGLDDDSVYRLIQGDWAKLTVLWIAGNPLGYESLRQSKLGNFFDLKELWIQGGNFGKGDVLQLIKFPTSKLATLKISPNTPDYIKERLAKRFPLASAL